ncbi:MAG: copper chaperone Copz family protein [Chlamydiae bacterium]|nr:copper chaperone Copz family protein [Chlamydiota bacterium]MBI3267131.1 copper chaperone Copz family protein [Chlamydiota bacterium]
MGNCCEPVRPVKTTCPECGKVGKPVQRVTPENLLKDISIIEDVPYWFCSTSECPVVYFSLQGGSLFHKSDLKVRVGIKEKEDPIPVCYCFGWDRVRIWDEIRQTGKSTAVEAITQEVSSGHCFCERSNPQGTCCLGNVAKAVGDGFKILK